MKKQTSLCALLLTLTTHGAVASDVTGLTSFTAGTPARAADVNGNFSAVKTAVDDNQAQITALEARIAALETKLASVTNTTENGQPTVLFRGVNVRIDNGMGSTATVNGTGNLIVGYNEADTSNFGRCTIGTNFGLSGVAAIVTDSTTCTNAGGAWITTGFKTGSHYIVTGTENNYSSYGGLLAGWQNTSNYRYASVIGGFNNNASGSVSTVTGGHHNKAGGDGASVSGGWSNTASGGTASVSGGAQNTASGAQSSVSGGGHTSSNGNVASGNFSSISGGYANTASGAIASISGGSANVADTESSSILGSNSQNTSTIGQTIPATP